MKILAIETSADDTAAAVVQLTAQGFGQILGQAIYTQAAEHQKYGGIVPEIASRAHQAHLKRLVGESLQQAGLGVQEIDAIAATTGPGLTTALAMGASFGKTLALALGKPFLATNHIEGHALSPLLTENLAEDQTLAEAFLTRQEPYVLLLITGGHTQLILVQAVGNYQLLGSTADDAVGECFDKTGAMLNLPHPAGPKIEILAVSGNPLALNFPHPRTANALDFSFSGLKTAVRQAVESQVHLPADIAASLQHTAAQLLAEKLKAALQHTGAKHAVVAGGVAANGTIRAALQHLCAAAGASFTAPPLALCTDNAAMIGYAAGLRQLHGLPDGGGLAAPLHPRWALNSL
jgi:N6-L-threonylcarbamoyladenine synthase